MEKNPIDYILEKIVCELLQIEGISTISQSCMNCLVDLLETYIRDIGRAACIEAAELSHPNPSINEIISGITTKLPLQTLYNYVNASQLPTVYGYNFPNTAFQHITDVPAASINSDISVFFKPIPPSHISKATPILGTEKNQDKAMNRKRLLEERRIVKKSICLVNEGNQILWETKELADENQHQLRDERLPTMPTNQVVTKNPNRLPEISSHKPIAFENEKGINVPVDNS